MDDAVADPIDARGEPGTPRDPQPRHRVRKRVRRRVRDDAPSADARAVLPRLLGAPAALLSAALCVFLAVHHPTLGAWSLLPLALAAAASAAAPGAWPLWLLPLLPLIGFMPWTGWIVVEELDLLVLAAAAGGYARWTVSGAPRASPEGALGAALGTSVLTLCLASLGISMLRGVADAGGWALGWWQGYHDPLNAVRLAKSLPAVLWLLPLWLRDHDRDPRQGVDRMLLGMSGMLATVGLAVLWERLAFTGLTNFNSDYRATGLFWEMHVGGAALDAALTLTFPFAVLALLRARNALHASVAGVAIVLGGYAALVTFSRVVYVGVPFGVAVMALLWLRRPDRTGAPLGVGAVAATAALLIAFAVAGLAVFPIGGYRALGAALGVFALFPAVLTALRGGPASAVAGGIAGGVLMAGLAWAAYAVLPKGAYVGYGLIAIATAAAALFGLVRAGQPEGHAAGGAGLAGLLGLCAGIVWVTGHWGGVSSPAPAIGVAVAAATVIIAAAYARRSPWPVSPFAHGAIAGGLVLVALVVGVFSGGSYMGGRLGTLREDVALRADHASRALSLRHGDGEVWFGRGLGRYVASQFMSGRPEDQTGTVSWREGADGPEMILTSGKHIVGWGEVFRVSQRIDPPGIRPIVKARIRAEAPVHLHGEVCEKHLLYNATCVVGLLKLSEGAPGWRDVEWPLAGEVPPDPGSPLTPRFITFSLALETPASLVEVASIELVGADGRALLRNGDFRDGGARWFFSSDRHHMPWHAKNAGIHLLVEQGWLGFVAVALAGLLAIWRTTLGRLRGHPLAPAIVGGLAGVLAVGSGDSLFDMPRVAFLLWLPVATALLMRPVATWPRVTPHDGRSAASSRTIAA